MRPDRALARPGGASHQEINPALALKTVDAASAGKVRVCFQDFSILFQVALSASDPKTDSPRRKAEIYLAAEATRGVFSSALTTENRSPTVYNAILGERSIG